MGKRLATLRQLDDRALNSWWGAALAPYAWITYRLGATAAPPGSRLTGYVLFGWPYGAIFNRGRTDGRQVAGSVVGWVVALGVVLVPIIVFILI